MAQTGSWNGITFEVSSSLIRSFDDMTIKGSCETETKTKNHQKYVKRKNGDVTELSFSVVISALLGVTSVRDEAMSFVKDARHGESAYFYYGTKKLFATKLMLTSAEVTEIVSLPGKPEKWVSCVVKLTFKRSESGSGSGSGSKKKKSKKKSVKSPGTKKSGGKSGVPDKIKGALGAVKSTIESAKKASKDKIKGVLGKSGGLKHQEGVVKKVTQGKNTGTKKTATTGRSTKVGGWLSKALGSLKK